jgi:hypothetical protein
MKEPEVMNGSVVLMEVVEDVIEVVEVVVVVVVVVVEEDSQLHPENDMHVPLHCPLIWQVPWRMH